MKKITLFLVIIVASTIAKLCAQTNNFTKFGLTTNGSSYFIVSDSAGNIYVNNYAGEGASTVSKISAGGSPQNNAWATAPNMDANLFSYISQGYLYVTSYVGSSATTRGDVYKIKLSTGAVSDFAYFSGININPTNVVVDSVTRWTYVTVYTQNGYPGCSNCGESYFYGISPTGTQSTISTLNNNGFNALTYSGATGYIYVATGTTISAYSSPGNTLVTSYDAGGAISSMTSDAAGNVYAEITVGNSVKITKLTPAGVLTTTTIYTSTTASPSNIVVNTQGAVFVIDKSSNTVYGLSPNGTTRSYTSTAANPTAITLDPSGYIYTVSINGVVSKMLTSSVLPITLSNFMGTKSAAGNLLAWAVANASNFKAFKLQRSSQGGNDYSTIATITYNTTQSNYSYTDYGAGSAAYYRLQLVDLDGTTSYSDVRFLSSANGSGFAFVQVSPVPASTTLNIELYSPNSDKVTYSVVDMLGKTLLVQQGTVAMGANTQQLDVSHLAPGSYLLSVKNSSGIALSKKIVKM